MNKNSILPPIFILSACITGVIFFNRHKQQQQLSASGTKKRKLQKIKTKSFKSQISATSVNQAQFLTLSLTALTSVGFVFRSIIRIADLLSLLRQDLNNSSFQSRSIYTGHITSPLSQKDLLLYTQSKSNNEYHLPKDLYLIEGNRKLIISDDTLKKSGLDWPVISFTIAPPTQQNPQNLNSNAKNILKWTWASLLSFLGLSAKVNFDFCERGLQIGSKVFLYGHGGQTLIDNGIVGLIDVEYLSDSADLLKNYLKEKVIKHTVFSIGALSIVLLTGFYLWNKFDFTVVNQNETIQSQEIKPKTEIAKTIDYVSNHYPLYKYKTAKSRMKCTCNKYFVNVINFPCSHFDSCFDCFTSKYQSQIGSQSHTHTRAQKTCSVCHSLILDYFILNLS